LRSRWAAPVSPSTSSSIRRWAVNPIIFAQQIGVGALFQKRAKVHDFVGHRWFIMRRREFITLLGSAIAWPLVARTQQAGKLSTIGFLSGPTASAAGQWVTAFKERLRELGWIEGRTVAIEYRWAGRLGWTKG
jgi:hypothetical protein